VNEATWLALTVSLTVVGGIWTWLALRRHGFPSALRALGFTLLPAAAWLTGTMEMFADIGSSVLDWATHLVLGPRAWVGIALVGIAVVLWLVSGVLRDRQLRRGRDAGAGASSATLPRGRGAAAASAPGTASGAAPVDDDLADIEALLKKRGIE
jgi:hypothetical protein